MQNLVAEIIRKEGYRAEYKTVLSLFGDFRPLAISAGLGEWGRNGLVVTKESGSGVLFAALFTDAPLEVAEPLTPDLLAQPTSAEGNCTSCNQCVDACPAGAIKINGNKVWVKEDICIGCGVCQNACKFDAIKLVQIGKPKGDLLDYFDGRLSLDLS